MLYKVDVWKHELKCEICKENKWYLSRLRTDFLNDDNPNEYNEKIRYMFDCSKCGNCKIFGRISAENDMNDTNLKLTPLQPD